MAHDSEKLRELLERVERKSDSARRNAASAQRMTRGLVLMGEVFTEESHAKLYDEIAGALRALISQAEGEAQHG